MSEPDITHVPAQIALLQAAVLSLMETHPDKAALRADFEQRGNHLLSEMLQHPVSDAAISEARTMLEAMLAGLSRTGPSVPPK
jgi:predicted ArsR family transcriptional regulator